MIGARTAWPVVVSAAALTAALACPGQAAAPLAPSRVASTGETVLQGELMRWPKASGTRYKSDPADSGAAGFRAAAGKSGQVAVRTTYALTGLAARIRSSQSGRCSGVPQVTVKIDRVPRLSAPVPPGGYIEPRADVAIPPGTHTLSIGMTKSRSRSACRRAIFVDKVTLVASTLFSPQSWRNKPLAPDAPLDPDQSLAKALAGQAAAYGAGVNTEKWSVPLYVVPAGQPLVDVGVDPVYTRYDAAGRSYLASDFSHIPLPPDALPAGPPEGNGVSWSDHALALYQPSTDTLWELYHLVKDQTGNWMATDGGRVSQVSLKTNFDAWPDGRPHGIAGAGLPETTGLQLLKELQAGSIDHVVAVTIPHVQKSVLRLPATRSDGAWTTSDAVPEGTLFRLPADLDIDALPITPYAKIVARAVQRYGLLVIDQDCLPNITSKCPAIGFRAEDPRPAPFFTGVNPYSKIFSGPDWKELDGFPWSRLQVLPSG